jgi:hypothetical protein
MSTAIFTSRSMAPKRSSGARHGELDPNVFGKKFGVVSSIFGCRHANLSRPFGHGETTYRSCLDCGARTLFDPVTLTTHGKFYCSPVSMR